MKKLILLSLIALSPAAMAANFAGDTTIEGNDIKVDLAKNRQGLEQAGLGAAGVYGGQIAAIDHFYGRTPKDTDGVSRFGKEAAPGSHKGMGKWAIGKAADEVYYGRWDDQGKSAAFYSGVNATQNLDSVKGQTIAYNITGVDGSKSNYHGEFQAKFNADAQGGNLSGSIANANRQVTLGHVGIDSHAGFSGKTTDAGDVSGHFFGAQAQALAGQIGYEQHSQDIGFGGVKK